MTKYVIRTSDRKRFKECRLAWDLGSKIRQNLEPKAVRTPLDFGTEIHAGLEAWYDPKLWHGDPLTRSALMHIAFKKSLKAHRRQYEKDGVLTDEVLEDLKERTTLGPQMLDHYVLWSKSRDKDLTPVYTEVEFEVPIERDYDIALPKGFCDINRGLLHKRYFIGVEEHWAPVVYQGRIDLIMQDKDGYYWIVDHKTVGPRGWAEESTDFLDRDEQCKSYAWAAKKMLNLNVKGVIYNQLYKGVAEPPQRLKTTRKGLSFSTSRSQDTNFELALETFKTKDRAAFKAGWYDPYLTWLKQEGRQYVRRHTVTYGPETLEVLGTQICQEAIDMLSDPYIYPNPNKWNCRWCDFRVPCLAHLDGRDYQNIKDTMYTIRKPSGDVIEN